MELLSKAIKRAVDAFDGKYRKGDGCAMIVHSMEACVVASSMTKDEEILSAAVLHDVVEDAGVSLEELESKFGKRVASLVASETEDKMRNIPPSDSWRARKESAVNVLRNTDDIGVKIIFLSDKLSNMRSFYNLKNKYGNAMWDKFNQKDVEEQHWYYRTISSLMPELESTLAWIEYDGLIKYVFDEK